MNVTQTDAVLWYNVGVFGQEGYAVPNCSNDPGTVNPNIADLVSLMGRNLFTIMHHPDASQRTPPSINTLQRVHRLYVRAGAILQGRSVPPGEVRFEPQHVHPAPEIFVVYPCPYFKVRNPHLKRWAGYVFGAMGEAMQHTENGNPSVISTNFGGLIGSYLKIVYSNMAIELFGKTREEANADGFLLTESDFTAYDPSKWFTSTEMMDTVPRLDRKFTEDQLAPLGEGIPVTSLPPLTPWPTNTVALYQQLRGDDINAEDDAFVSPGVESGNAATGGTTKGREQPIVPPAPAP